MRFSWIFWCDFIKLELLYWKKLAFEGQFCFYFFKTRSYNFQELKLQVHSQLWKIQIFFQV